MCLILEVEVCPVLCANLMSRVSWSCVERPEAKFRPRAEMKFALKHHWPEYLIEAAGLCFFMMSVVLITSNTTRLNHFTGLFAAILVAAYIGFENPFSGMSMNPARTFGSAVSAHLWTALWVYFTARPLGMLLAAEAYTRTK